MQRLQAKKQKAKFRSKIFYILRDKEYCFNKPYLKEFIDSNGNKKYKLTIMRCVKNSAVESPINNRCLVNSTKLENNLQRSKTLIYEYSFCNKWDFFFTGTLDKTKANREDLREFNKTFHDFIFIFNRKYNCKLVYLIIPELHSDMKSWHFHGFVAGIPKDRIKEFKIGDKMGKKIADKLALGQQVFHWLDWDKKFGFNDLEFIRSTEAISAYVTKYITKDLQKSVKELNAHVYYCSKGLNKANVLSAKKLDLSPVQKLKPDFSNKHCSLYWFSESQYNALLNYSNDNLQQNENCINSNLALDIQI